MNTMRLPITQHIRYGLAPLPFGTLFPMVATSYMLGTLYAIMEEEQLVVKKICVNVISLKRQKDWR